jgi:hypothetical protein
VLGDLLDTHFSLTRACLHHVHEGEVIKEDGRPASLAERRAAPNEGADRMNDRSASGEGDFLDELEQVASASEDEWKALDAELDERLDVDESAPEEWGDGRVALEPGEKFRGYFRSTTPNPAEDRHDVLLLETLEERQPVYMYGSRMLLGELEKSGAKPGDMIAIGRRLEDGMNAQGISYPYYRVRSRPVDDDIPI